MLETGVGTEGDADGADGFVSFLEAGSAASGEYHCADCGYGVSVQARLPACPMCGGTSWEPVAWTPLARARVHQL